MTQSDEDRGKQCFLGARGLKVSDREIKDSSSSEFTLLCLSYSGFLWEKLAAECQNPVGEKSHSLSTHEWVVSTTVCACICDIVRMAFVLALQCDF